jgi:endonuclease YncB( thermonuclease family)
LIILEKLGYKLKKLIVGLIVIVIAFSASFVFAFAATCNKVTDGDTVWVVREDNKNKVKVRLYGVDAPELKQVYGTKAKKYLTNLVYNKKVEVTEVNVDRYGRTVAKVYLGNFYVNGDLVRTGNAWWYQAYAKNDSDLQKLESNAKINKVGLWAYKNPIPPWKFRKK